MSVITYHSQAATRQDEWVISKSPAHTPGYYAEIGAHNGVRHSNTLTLEESLGWSGLLVEANPVLFAELQQNRGETNQCVQAVVGPYNALGEQFAVGDAASNSYSGLTRHMTQKWLEGHEIHKSRFVHVETHTLRAVLNAAKAPTLIDYLSLDVEGAEYSILESFIERRCSHSPDYKFRLMTVEFLYDRRTLDQLEQLLEPEYRLDQVRAFDACFIHRDFT